MKENAKAEAFFKTSESVQTKWWAVLAHSHPNTVNGYNIVDTEHHESFRFPQRNNVCQVTPTCCFTVSCWDCNLWTNRARFSISCWLTFRSFENLPLCAWSSWNWHTERRSLLQNCIKWRMGITPQMKHLKDIRECEKYFGNYVKVVASSKY